MGGCGMGGCGMGGCGMGGCGVGGWGICTGSGGGEAVSAGRNRAGHGVRGHSRTSPPPLIPIIVAHVYSPDTRRHAFQHRCQAWPRLGLRVLPPCACDPKRTQYCRRACALVYFTGLS